MPTDSENHSDALFGQTLGTRRLDPPRRGSESCRTHGGYIRVASLDCGRDNRDLYPLVDTLTGKGCAVTFVSESITVSKDDSCPMQELFLTFL